ncbi:MAG TPA: PilZ domain-containing protein [Terriglobales bacterium]|nr:PilZ domain-containing protein [Terriglobales bacterium]
MGRRYAPRVPVSIPVWVFGVEASGLPFAQAAQTVEISKSGAMLEGMRYAPRSGGIVTVQCGQKKGRFKVIWVGEKNTPKAGRLAIRALEPAKFGWSVSVPEASTDFFRTAEDGSLETSQLPSRGEADSKSGKKLRRRHDRFSCEVVVQVCREGGGSPMYCQMNDVSTSGCYVVTRTPLVVDSRVEFIFRDRGSDVKGRGVVRTSHACLGMGIEFTSMQPEHRQALDKFLARLANQSLKPNVDQDVEILKPIVAVAPAKPVNGDTSYYMPGAENFRAAQVLERLLQVFRESGALSREDFMKILLDSQSNQRKQADAIDYAFSAAPATPQIV